MPFIREISDSNLETQRNGSKSGLSQIICESRQPCKLSLYYTLIYPYLSYCNIVWSSTYNTRLNIIFPLQKSAIHALTITRNCAHTAPLFVKPKILNIFGVFMFHVAKFMFCFHHHLMGTFLHLEAVLNLLLFWY